MQLVAPFLENRVGRSNHVISRPSSHRRHLTRLGAASLLPLILGGCGGGAIMSSYDAEKARIRAALPGDITCNERPSGDIRRMSCGNGPLDVTLSGMSGSPEQVDLLVAYNEFFGPSPEAFASIMKAYGFDAADIQRCDAQGNYTKQLQGYAVRCTGFSGVDFSVQITQQKAV